MTVTGVALGFAVAFAVGPREASSPCDGVAFVSPTFGYCVELPTGWEASVAADEPGGVDALRSDADQVVVYVEGAALDAADLEAFTRQIRERDSLRGYAMTEPESGELGGAPTLEWYVMVSADGVEATVRAIAVVRGPNAWLLQVADRTGSGEADLDAARIVLDTWRFA